jgi:hypothetical protein
MRLGWSLAAIVGVAGSFLPSAAAADSSSTAADDVERARALDQQGVRAFRDGHYNDAIRYFTEAFRLGAPSSELWNIARCYVKLDQPEAASEALEHYLAKSDLSAEDRAGARRELEELAHRPSTVTIASSPTGAFVAVDGKRVGRTPTSIDVAAGEHTIAVQREGYPPHTERVTARYGRAVIVDARLGGGSTPAAGNGGAAVAESRHRFTGSAEMAGLFARLGSVGRPIHPAALVSLGYLALEKGALDVAVGARLTLTYDSWNDSVHAPALGCGLGGTETATALAAFADGALGYHFTPKIRLGGDLGFGFASELASQLGGDVFVPSCKAAPGLVPAGHVGAELSYAVLPLMRVVVSPIVFEVSSAFHGARTTPLDASGAWLRVGGGLGLAVDL